MAEILEIVSERVLVMADGGEVLVVDDREIQLIAEAQQGPPGIPGTEVTNIDCGTFN